MKMAFFWRWGVLILLAALSGCGSPSVLPPVSSSSSAAARLILSPVDYDHLPGWRDDAASQVLPAFKKSCQRLAQMPPTQPVGSDGQGGLAGDWLAPCGALRAIGEGDDRAARTFFETWFSPFRASNQGQPDGLFTAYYEAELRGSRQFSSRYRFPIYGRPSGLAADSAAQPGLSRAEIEAGSLAGRAPILLWVDDAVDAHILHIQGSGRVSLEDGTIVRLGFNGSNGHSFVGLGQILLDHGKLGPGETTMQSVRSWLKSHSDEAPSLMAENPRYVFFREIHGDGPIGAAGVPLTPGRSLAVDPKFIAYGMVMWLDSLDPDGRPFRRLMVAQDTGAAIKGPVRGDIFWGTGETALNFAGRMKSRGNYYLLLPKRRSTPIAALVGLVRRV